MAEKYRIMAKNQDIKNLSNRLRISLPAGEIFNTYFPKKHFKTSQQMYNSIYAIKQRKVKISASVLKSLIRFHTRVLDVKEQKTSREADLALVLISNLCNLKPPNKFLINLLAKSLRKLEMLNPLFLPLIIGKGNPNFSVLVYTSSIKKKLADELTSFEELKGNTIHFGNNKVMILLNTSALGFYSEDVFLHELLHVVDDMIAADSKGKKRYFHNIINRKHNNILYRVAVNYKNDQKKAHRDFAKWLQKTYLPDEHAQQVKILKEGIELIYYKKYKLWAADEGMAEEILLAKKFLGKEIGASAEVFAYGLQYYLNPKGRRILKKRNLILYNLLKDVIVPALKNIRVNSQN